MSAETAVSPKFFALAVVLVVFEACASPPEPPRNLVFVSLDTTRPDRMSLYGYERETTPWMKEFFATGTVFENAVTQFNTTVPSHTSMFTGVYPHTHGNRRRTGFSEEYTTLAEILKARGFRTGAAVSGYPLKDESCLLDRGFEAYSSRFKGSRRDGSVTIDHATRWLESLSPEEPFFLFVHLYDAHGPYRAGEHLESFLSDAPGPHLQYLPGYQRRWDQNGEVFDTLNPYLDRYDSQIRYQDELVEKLISYVDPEQTLVVLTSDHGETFAERGRAWNLNHGHSVYVEQSRIPMAFRGPGVGVGRLEDIIETVDLLPTVLDLMAVEADGSLWEGVSFADRLSGSDSAPRDQLGYTSSDSKVKVWASIGYELDVSRKIHSLESPRWKLIKYPGREGDFYELYDRREDPHEMKPVTEAHPDVVERMGAALERWLATAGKPAATPQDLEGDLDSLRALGYVN